MNQRPTPRIQRLSVEGMQCEDCKDKVERALRGLTGVENVDVDLSKGTATVAGDVEADDLLQALSYTDYQARPLH